MLVFISCLVSSRILLYRRRNWRKSIVGQRSDIFLAVHLFFYP